MTSLVSDLTWIISGLAESHKHSGCACSGIAAWLSQLQQLEPMKDIIPGSGQHNGLSCLLAVIGSGTLINSHTLESQQSALEAFETWVKTLPT